MGNGTKKSGSLGSFKEIAVLESSQNFSANCDTFLSNRNSILWRNAVVSVIVSK